MEIVALPLYRKAVKRLLLKAERGALEASLAANRLAHTVMPRTGGFPKACWAVATGARVAASGRSTITSSRETVFLFDVYANNEKETLTYDEENYLRRFTEEIESRKKRV